MIERIEDVPPAIDAVRAVGKITREDYDAVVLPLVDAAAREGRRLRILCEVGPEFHGLTPSAAWEDVKIGLRAWRLIEGCAVVSDIGWIREASRFAGFLMPCPCGSSPSGIATAPSGGWIRCPRLPGSPTGSFPSPAWSSSR